MSYPDSKDQNRPADSLEEAFGKPHSYPQNNPFRQPGHQGQQPQHPHNPYGQGRPNPFGAQNPWQQGGPQATQPAPEPAEAPAEPVADRSAEVDSLTARVAELETEVKDVQARANAEMYNLQRRVEREVDNARKYALEKFSTSLLDVVDNLERAVDAGSNPEDPVIQGVQLTHKSLLSALEKFGVEMVNPQDAPFDAELHQAVGVLPDVPANQVGRVLQKGYTLNGRLLRPAMVMVGQ